MTMRFGANYKDFLLEMLNTKTLLSRSVTKRQKLLEDEMSNDLELTGVSLGLFASDNGFRNILYKLVNGSNIYFERLIVFFIAVSSV